MQWVAQHRPKLNRKWAYDGCVSDIFAGRVATEAPKNSGNAMDLKRLMREATGRLSFGIRRSPLTSFSDFSDFVHGNAAYIAQKKLYDYVKTRMGTNYVRMFEDDVFIESLKMSRMFVFAACLSDLTLYAIAYLTKDEDMTRQERRDLAVEVYERGIAENLQHAPDAKWSRDACAAFAMRADVADWGGVALSWENFTQSPEALFKYAPIADALRDADREIVENSIKFAWRDVREEFRRRLDAPAVMADWRGKRARSGVRDGTPGSGVSDSP